MTEAPVPRTGPPPVLLIDLDNCPQQLGQLQEHLKECVRILVCYGSQEPKLPLSLATALAEPILSGRLEIVGMRKKGKNAADFGLCFHAGRMMAEMPAETEFTILSEDKDLDHAVDLLRTGGRKAKRANGKTRGSKQGLSTDVELAAGEFATRRLQEKMPRPARRETLRNSIEAFVKGRYEVAADDVLTWLAEHGWLEITPADKVQYAARIADYPVLDDEDDIPF